MAEEREDMQLQVSRINDRTKIMREDITSIKIQMKEQDARNLVIHDMQRTLQDTLEEIKEIKINIGTIEHTLKQHQTEIDSIKVRLLVVSSIWGAFLAVLIFILNYGDKISRIFE